MLLVPTPRYSLSSTRVGPSMTTTPRPAGPGLPEQAPSAYAMTAPGGCAVLGPAAAPLVLLPAALPAPASGLVTPSAAPQVSSGSGVASLTSRLSARAW